MASGFAKDGAVQDQIEASTQDAIDRAKRKSTKGIQSNQL